MAAPTPITAPPIDPREFQRVADQFRAHRLGETSPYFSLLLRSINVARPTPSDVRRYQELKTAVENRQAALAENPFGPTTVPPQPGDIDLGVQKFDNQPINLDTNRLCGNLGAIGGTGSAKTSFLSHIIRQLRTIRPDVQICFLDPKDDWRREAINDDECIIIHDQLPLALLAPVSFLTNDFFDAVFIRRFTQSFYGGYHMTRILQDALRDVRRRNHSPSLADLVDTIKGSVSRSQTFQHRDAAENTLTRLESLRAALPGAYNASAGITFEDLCNKPFYLPSPTQLDTFEFVFTHVLELRFLHHRHQGWRDTLRTLFITDEGIQTWLAHNTQHISGTSHASHLASMVREFGIAIAYTATSLRLLDPLLRANTSTLVAMRPHDGTEARELGLTLRLNQQQQEYFEHRMAPGEYLLRRADNPVPVLGVFPPPPNDKAVTNAEWTATISQRHPTAVPATMPSASVQAPPPVATPAGTTVTRSPVKPVLQKTAQNGGTTAQNTTVTTNTTAANTTIATPLAHSTTAPADTTPVRLSVAEEALLRTIARENILTVTDAYKAARIPAQVGDRAAKKAETLGLLSRTPIVVRPGRGGSAIALSLTKEGYERINTTPPRGLRGGSGIQHQYLVTKLATAISGSMVETTLGHAGKGGKSIDLLVRRTPEHDHLLDAITRNANLLSEDRVVNAPNDLVAIEIETSPDTVTNNALKNLESGVALNVSAVMPKALEAAKRALLRDIPAALLPRVVLIDVLQLLEGLNK